MSVVVRGEYRRYPSLGSVFLRRPAVAVQELAGSRVGTAAEAALEFKHSTGARGLSAPHDGGR